MAKDKAKADDDQPQGVLAQHHDRMKNDQAYRERVLTAPGGTPSRFA